MEPHLIASRRPAFTAVRRADVLAAMCTLMGPALQTGTTSQTCGPGEKGDSLFIVFVRATGAMLSNDAVIAYRLAVAQHLQRLLDIEPEPAALGAGTPAGRGSEPAHSANPAVLEPRRRTRGAA